MHLDSIEHRLGLMPRDETRFIGIKLIPYILKALLSHLSSMLELITKMLMQMLKELLHPSSIQLLLALGIDALKDLLHLPVDHVFVLLGLLVGFLLVLVDKIIELDNILICSDDLGVLVLTQVADAAGDGGFDLQVGLQLHQGQV